MVAPILAATAVKVAVDTLPSIIETIGEIIGRFIPDPEQRQKAVMEIVGVLQTSDQAQAEILKAEAQSTSFWVAGARPSAMWVSVFGMAYVYIVQPILAWASLNFGWIEPPMIDGEALMTLLFGILGLGAYRSLERIKGVIPPGK